MVYHRRMETWLEIPKDRKRLSVVRLCLIMGMTALLFLVIANKFSEAAEIILRAPAY